MDTMKLHSRNLTEEKISKIREMFPGCVTETQDKTEEIRLAVDFNRSA